MSNVIPERIPDCAERLLARPEWFSDPSIVKRARIRLASGIAAFLSSERFSGGNISAITLGKTIHFRHVDHYDPHSAKGLALLAHELKHVEQYEHEGLIRFYAKYLRGYFQHGYGKKIAFEESAYSLESSVKAHLRSEFENNPGRDPCMQMAEPHTPNLQFALTTPEVLEDDSQD